MSLNIEDIETLRNFLDSLKRFSEKTKNNIDSIQSELHRSLEWVDDRVQHWRSSVQWAEENVDQALDDLKRRERESDDDEDGYDCYSYEKEALEEANRRLAECKEKLENARYWQRNLKDAIEEYHKSTRYFYNLATDHSDKAIAFVSDKVEKYSTFYSGGFSNLPNFSGYANNYVIGDSCRIVPNGGLQRHEKKSHEKTGGHTIEKHIEKSDGYIIGRISKKQPIISAFFNREIAEWAISKTLASKNNNIFNAQIKITMNLSKIIGHCILYDECNNAVRVETNRICIFLKKDNLSKNDYKIVTAYPIINDYE